MSDDKKSLLLFQLGPVQSFIAQAQTVGDLAVGSAILSEITKAAIQAVDGYKAALVFPSPVGNEQLEGIPNRFLMYVPKGKGAEIATRCEEAAREALGTLADETYKIFNRNHPGELNNPAAFLAQVNQFLQITWAVLEDPTGDMGVDYKAIGKLMAMRRNTREFDQWHEEGYDQQKDVLSGKEVALCDGLGAMNLIKRFKTEQEPKRFKIPESLKPSKDKKGIYLAVIAMDGDKMGATLSGFKNEGDHREFSEKLGQFAKSVKDDIPKEKSNSENGEETDTGLLIYAGGDDVLAVVKATDAIDVAKKLQERFNKDVGNTASAGIAIGHSTVPLQDLVHAAHKAESQAKQVYDRGALAVAIYKRSGEILEWGCKWDSPALAIYKKLTELSNEKGLKIGRFPYKLAALLQPYELEKKPKGQDNNKVLDETMQEIVMAEFDHAVAQTEDIKGKLPRDEVKKYLKACCNAKKPEDFLKLFMVETFINRPREGEDN